jgi:putative glutathione S-transferase
MGKDGWTFDEGPGVIPDPILGAQRLYEVYIRSHPTYTGRVTVPVLWDKQRNVIVSNESSEIIRMLNSAFDHIAASPADFYPADFYPTDLRDMIDTFNARIYATVNNGVYKAGFATTQEAYEEAVCPLFSTLDLLEDRLAAHRYLCGERLTEADWRLFTTLVRFDAVYVGHFKCNLRRIADYPNLWGFTRELFQYPGIAETTNFTHIKQHYYQSHESINPTRIVPVGPDLDFLSPHGRERHPAQRRQSDRTAPAA